MKKLNINKAYPGPDLSSISALPAGLDNSRHVNTLRTRLDGRSAPAAQAFNNRHIPPMRSSYAPLNSQSQQSFSQVSQNTLLSQNSQEEIIPNDQIKEEKGTGESLLDSLKTVSDRIIEESSKLKLDEISNALEVIPKTMTESLSAVKSEICLAFTQNLQDISQRLKESEKEYETAKQVAVKPTETFIDVRSQTKQLQKEYHKPSSYNVMHSRILKKPKTKTYQIPKTQPIIKSSLHTGKVVDRYQPVNNTYARRTWKRENLRDEQESPYSDEQVTQKSKMSEILINMEDNDEEKLLYFMKKQGMARKVHFLDDPCRNPQRQKNTYEEDEEETRKILQRARRKRRNKDLYNFNFSPESSSDY